MNFSAIKSKATDFFAEAPFIARIANEHDYENALALMDELIENYDLYRPLIDMLASSIEKWEDSADEFADFNETITKFDTGAAVLQTLMNQYQLKADDLRNEIGGKSLVSMILNGKRKLTVDHIAALSARFNISPEVFMPSITASFLDA